MPESENYWTYIIYIAIIVVFAVVMKMPKKR